MTVSFHQEAQQELREAVAFYRERGGKELAKVFLKEIHRVAKLLDANPGFGTP